MSAKKKSGNDRWKITIAEDSPTQAEQLRYILETNGYEVVAASNGKEALALVRSSKPDILISDIVMPEMDGYELCRQIKRDEKLKDIPVILLTALSDPADVIKGLECGADNFVTKPYDERGLLSRIEYLRLNRGLQETDSMRLGLEITFAGRKYSITSDRLQILNLLLSTYESAVTRNRELKQAQAELRRLNEQLEERVRARSAELERANEELRSEISERKRAEAKLRGVNRLLRTVRNVNQLIVRENDRKKILTGICKILLNTGGYSGVWVALLDNSQGLIDVSEGGLGDRFQPLLKELKRGRLVHCAQQAMSQSDAVVVTPKTQSDCDGCVFSKSGCAYDTICVRLEYQKRTYGVLFALTPKSIDLLEEEKGLFNELAHDVAFALHKIELAEKHEQAAAALQRSEEKYRSLVNNVRLGILRSTVGPPGRILEVNPAFERILGYSRDELLLMDMEELYVNREERQALIEELASAKGALSREFHWRKKDGSEIVVMDTLSVLRDEAGNILYVDAIVEDITERKQMQEQLILTDRLASIGEVSSGIAHELNNPLTAVIGFSEILLERDVPDDMREDLETIYSEAKRAANVVKNLLTFARKHPPGKQPVNINSAIQKALDIRAYEQNVNNIQVIKRFADDLPEIMADGFQLQQVFFNIIINAEYFMTEAHHGGTLTITTGKTDNMVRVSLADDGPGISKEKLGHLFDPFFTTKEVGKGTGLGLSICHGVVTEHGGRIYAQSEAGKGATFIVELPITATASSGAEDE